MEMWTTVTAPSSDLISTVAGLLDLEQTLNLEERDLLTAHVSQSTTEITLALSQDQDILIQLPPKPPPWQHTLKLKKKKGKANS